MKHAFDLPLVPAPRLPCAHGWLGKRPCQGMPLLTPFATAAYPGFQHTSGNGCVPAFPCRPVLTPTTPIHPVPGPAGNRQDHQHPVCGAGAAGPALQGRRAGAERLRRQVPPWVPGLPAVLCAWGSCWKEWAPTPVHTLLPVHPHVCTLHLPSHRILCASSFPSCR